MRGIFGIVISSLLLSACNGMLLLDTAEEGGDHDAGSRLGPDAAAPDGRDASLPTDAGPDTMSDGGGSDAALVDHTDAGPPDAGTPDAGPLDGGPIDPITCACDLTVAPTDSELDLSALAPGSVVCVRARDGASRGPLTLRNARGTPSAPIVVRNCDGRVEVRSTSRRAALSLQRSSHVRVSGAGASGVEHGLLLGAPEAAMAVHVGDVDHYELDHLEIDASGFAGIMAKVDPSSTDCREFDRRYSAFVMTGVSIHHNFIHDVDGEGLYLGNSFYGGATTQYCGGNASCDLSRCGGVQYPHEVREVRVYANVVERTGWDGLQIGAAVADCEVYDNRVRSFALENRSSQNHGIQIGGGSSCRVYRNYLEDGPVGMHIAGVGGTDVINNVMVGFDSYGIIVNPRPTPLATDVADRGYVGGFRILHNTFVAPTNGGRIVRDVNVPDNPVPTSGNRVANNLVVSASDGWLQLTGRYGWVQDHDVRVASAAAAGVIDPEACPSASSVVVDAGADLRDVVEDHRGAPRPLGAAPDLGALECH